MTATGFYCSLIAPKKGLPVIIQRASHPPPHPIPTLTLTPTQHPRIKSFCGFVICLFPDEIQIVFAVVSGNSWRSGFHHMRWRMI